MNQAWLLTNLVNIWFDTVIRDESYALAAGMKAYESYIYCFQESRYLLTHVYKIGTLLSKKVFVHICFHKQLGSFLSNFDTIWFLK